MLVPYEKIKNMQICRISRIYAKSSRNLASKAKKTAPKLRQKQREITRRKYRRNQSFILGGNALSIKVSSCKRRKL